MSSHEEGKSMRILLTFIIFLLGSGVQASPPVRYCPPASQVQANIFVIRQQQLLYNFVLQKQLLNYQYQLQLQQAQYQAQIRALYGR